MMNKVCKFLKHESGASLVEMTAVAPFLFFLTFGIFEFGNVLYQHHLITTGVRDAARYLARVPATAGGPASGEDEARQIAVTGSPTGGDKRVSWWNTGTITIDYRDVPNPCGAGAYRGCPNDVRIIVVATNVSYNELGYLGLLGVGPTLDFTITHEERYIGR